MINLNKVMVVAVADKAGVVTPATERRWLSAMDDTGMRFYLDAEASGYAYDDCMQAIVIGDLFGHEEITDKLTDSELEALAKEASMLPYTPWLPDSVVGCIRTHDVDALNQMVNNDPDRVASIKYLKDRISREYAVKS